MFYAMRRSFIFADQDRRYRLNPQQLRAFLMLPQSFSEVCTDMRERVCV